MSWLSFPGRRFVLDHRLTQSRASDYLDGDLGPAERRRIERHASVCPKCHELLESLRRTVTSLGGLRLEQRGNMAASVIDRLRRDA